VAAAVEQEVRLLQSAKRIDKKLRAVNREARKALRTCKDRLGLLAETAGFRFHGRAMRRRRNLASGKAV